MSVTHVVGVDPGLVHTGVVSMQFIAPKKKIFVNHEAVAGLDTLALKGAIDSWEHIVRHSATIFIEGYRPRSNLNSDKRMVEGVAAIRKATGGQVLDNTGVKKVVRKSLMDLLGVWSFSTVTHHQDLRSAARIALLGMAKDGDMNRLLADIVRDHVEGRDWCVVH
jgi:hypothetical protein